jgi:hypothetical protein
MKFLLGATGFGGGNINSVPLASEEAAASGIAIAVEKRPILMISGACR